MRLGVVVIGRNEGDRLERCLRSLRGAGSPMVYVDSGSTDGSVKRAADWGASVVELDPSTGFTAARARNAGFEQLIAQHPGIELVQFVDGDCEVASGWLAHAARELEMAPQLAVVCGRRRERFREHSTYNRLCDIEWDTPVGEAKACGGDAMMRVSAFRQVGGFDPAIIAGEEPELCVRLRREGWTIRRIAAEMTLHDAAMSRFGQWWKRAVRSGHAFAEGAALHGASPERHYVKQRRSLFFWGLVNPLLALGLAYITRGWSLALLFGYPALALRILRAGRARGLSSHDARTYAVFCVLAKFPEGLGQMAYIAARLRGRPRQLIEYKRAAAGGADRTTVSHS
jgi:GT2 family glycosyltransferase